MCASEYVSVYRRMGFALAISLTALSVLLALVISREKKNYKDRKAKGRCCGYVPTEKE